MSFYIHVVYQRKNLKKINFSGRNFVFTSIIYVNVKVDHSASTLEIIQPKSQGIQKIIRNSTKFQFNVPKKVDMNFRLLFKKKKNSSSRATTSAFFFVSFNFVKICARRSKKMPKKNPRVGNLN